MLKKKVHFLLSKCKVGYITSYLFITFGLLYSPLFLLSWQSWAESGMIKSVASCIFYSFHFIEVVTMLFRAYHSLLYS